MDFIIGGSYQGKTQYVKETYGYEESEIVYGDDSEALKKVEKLCLVGLHLLVRQLMLEHKDIKKELAEFREKNKLQVIVTDEIGYGVIPLDAFEREYRECVGRICCEIAGESDHMIRICAGVAQRIKG